MAQNKNKQTGPAVFKLWLQRCAVLQLPEATASMASGQGFWDMMSKTYGGLMAMDQAMKYNSNLYSCTWISTPFLLCQS